MPETTNLLDVEDLSLSFSGVRAIDGVTFSVREGELFSVIGPNGAGKSSLFNCISGVYKPQSGSIRFAGDQLIGLKPHRIARKGIARTFQNVDVFPAMTVQENLLLARDGFMRAGALGCMIRIGRSAREEREAAAAVEHYAELLHITDLLAAPVGSLPHGTQKRVELARVLAAEPRLIMLDEPVAGMNHDETGEMAATIQRVNRELRVAILLVEHDMSMVMGISDRVCALDFGQRIALGSPAEVAGDALVVNAYLGGAL
ncbi:ATP-binding cassette domain-containing protein [Nocardioides sp. MAH-18]|uniref:ATP-binding cassette domain-containing protein n=1 Tax=Nocardioides agri TaxID=2682843 RepID=A0A6L6XP01_9ACTN|nr:MULTISPECIES: ABC transporter ATP-binding protein [unclassified Nocardioides]MBA2953803.1 ABC transporter ATP-binding protein [Nocardioides sp. CGMCC 1.13656]MVQ48668.1 ATP-binding cassette domain-containing protein [Nocardioides sp. MAH-18]